MNNRGQRELAFRPAAETCHTPLIPWGGTHTAAGPDAAVIQRPPRPGPRLQGRSGRPGCAETDRAQRAARPLRPKTMVRRRRGRGPGEAGAGGREREKRMRCPAWFQVQKTSRWGRGIEIVTGHRVACRGFRREANASEQHGSALSAVLLRRSRHPGSGERAAGAAAGRPVSSTGPRVNDPGRTGNLDQKTGKAPKGGAFPKSTTAPASDAPRSTPTNRPYRDGVPRNGPG